MPGAHFMDGTVTRATSGGNRKTMTGKKKEEKTQRNRQRQQRGTDKGKKRKRKQNTHTHTHTHTGIRWSLRPPMHPTQRPPPATRNPPPDQRPLPSARFSRSPVSCAHPSHSSASRRGLAAGRAPHHRRPSRSHGRRHWWRCRRCRRCRRSPHSPRRSSRRCRRGRRHRRLSTRPPRQSGPSHIRRSSQTRPPAGAHRRHTAPAPLGRGRGGSTRGRRRRRRACAPHTAGTRPSRRGCSRWTRRRRHSLRTTVERGRRLPSSRVRGQGGGRARREGGKVRRRRVEVPT
ncbi:hypothetical protein I4F81_001576 [Pyropia yezoensis]|uniref:Uncharacterized protein n=1 Tax=Pyropia yezoensis TaxID=2788 RepID=A0ACC3BM30_PYRYE|nr:hypothetical protein I4F81_001576 [Neopyropia yezoensis]